MYFSDHTPFLRGLCLMVRGRHLGHSHQISTQIFLLDRDHIGITIEDWEIEHLQGKYNKQFIIILYIMPQKTFDYIKTYISD